MSLLEELPFELVRKDGSRRRAAFFEITDAAWTDIWSPRPDFRGAAYQFLIGVLQTALAPEDQEHWQELWDTPPTEAELQAALAPYASAFNLDGNSWRFMQDNDLGDVESKSIANLLIESPGDNTIRKNRDHFIKRGRVEQTCPACAAMALFTLQVNAPGGGSGHRASLRGGGPLTTLLVPNVADVILWQKLWLNVLPQDALAYGSSRCLSDVLPWVGKTRTSEAKTGIESTPEHVHRLQAYWSTPRRISLEIEVAPDSRCDLCGADTDEVVRQYGTQNYGINYTGAWQHPLTPYSVDPKIGLLSIKGQEGGIGYRHWLGLALGSVADNREAARIVGHFNQHLTKRVPARLWCFGFDMEKMKARCWYDATLPLHEIEPAQQRAFINAVRSVLELATEAAKLLNSHVKAARFSRPGDVPSDPAIPQSFWQESEPGFYALLKQLADTRMDDDAAVAGIYRSWLTDVSRIALRLFDQWVESVPIEDGNMGRIVRQREELRKWLNANKIAKELWKIVKAYQKEAA